MASAIASGMSEDVRVKHPSSPCCLGTLAAKAVGGLRIHDRVDKWWGSVVIAHPPLVITAVLDQAVVPWLNLGQVLFIPHAHEEEMRILVKQRPEGFIRAIMADHVEDRLMQGRSLADSPHVFAGRTGNLDLQAQAELPIDEPRIRTRGVEIASFLRLLERIPAVDPLQYLLGHGQQGYNKDDPLTPPLRSVVTFRHCDFYAYELSRITGFPAMQLYWPLAKRDAAIAAIRKFLQQYGDDFQDRPDDPYDDFAYGNNTDQTHLNLPHLNHPATPMDVSEGRAIFTLAGTTRVWAMPGFPISADRPGVKMDPSMGTELLPDGTNKTGYTYTTEGRVWQAEEVLPQCHWERYYGFEGRHQLEKVAASEIDFPSGYPWVGLGDGLDGCLDFPMARTVRPNMFTTYHVVELGTPLVATVKIRNPAGLDENIDPVFVLPAHANHNLPPGVTLSLSYSGKIPPTYFGLHLNPPPNPPPVCSALTPDTVSEPQSSRIRSKKLRRIVRFKLPPLHLWRFWYAS
jgi:hypothetical protein